VLPGRAALGTGAGCTPLPPWVCSGQVCGNWQGWYDEFALVQLVVTGYKVTWGILVVDPEFKANGEATQYFNVTPYFGFIPGGGGSGGGSNSPTLKVSSYIDKVNACNMVSAGAGTARAIDGIVAYGGGAAGIATSVSDKTGGLNGSTQHLAGTVLD
jgi:hypothetical protein